MGVSTELAGLTGLVGRAVVVLGRLEPPAKRVTDFQMTVVVSAVIQVPEIYVCRRRIYLHVQKSMLVNILNTQLVYSYV